MIFHLLPLIDMVIHPMKGRKNVTLAHRKIGAQEVYGDSCRIILGKPEVWNRPRRFMHPEDTMIMA